MKKIAVFADVQNLYYTVRQAYGCHFNYAALWADISQRGQIVEAYAYAIDRGDSKRRQGSSSSNSSRSCATWALP